EHLGADLQSGPLADLEFLGQRHVQIADSIATQIREMPRSIARDVITGILETSVIEIGSPRPRRLMETDAGRKLRADHIRTLIAVDQSPSVSHNNRDWLARLQREEALQRPAAHNGIRNAIHAATDPTTSTDGQVKNDCRCQSMSRII